MTHTYYRKNGLGKVHSVVERKTDRVYGAVKRAVLSKAGNFSAKDFPEFSYESIKAYLNELGRKDELIIVRPGSKLFKIPAIYRNK